MHRRNQHLADHRSQTPAAGARPRATTLLLLLALAQLMVILDISAVNVALPDLAGDLDIGGGDLGWTDHELLARLRQPAAARRTRRRPARAPARVPHRASACSPSPRWPRRWPPAPRSSSPRAPARGSARRMLSPAALSIITTTFQGPARAKALGVWGAVGGAGAAIGVLLGGTLTELVDWRAIFLINLPVGIGVAARGDEGRARRRRSARSGGASTCAARWSRRRAWARWSTRSRRPPTPAGRRRRRSASALAGLAGLAVFAALELRTRKPLLNIARLGERGVGGGFVMMLAASAVLFGSFLLTSIYLQDVLGTGALETGLAFLPMAVIIGLGAHLGSHLVGHAGLRIAMAAAFALTAGGHAAALRRREPTAATPRDVLPGHARRGLGPRHRAGRRWRCRCSPAPPTRRPGMLSGLNTTGHEIGGSLGVAVLVTIATGALGTATSTAGSPTASATRSWSPASSPRRRASSPCSCCRRRRASCRSCASLRASPSTRRTMPASHHTRRRSRPPRRRADAERSIARILDAAVDALGEDQEASMAEIARRAGVVRATIYVHFPTREALLEAVTERALAEVAAVIAAAEPERGDAGGSAGARRRGDVAHARALPRARRDQHRRADARGAPPPPRLRARACCSRSSNAARPTGDFRARRSRRHGTSRC